MSAAKTSLCTQVRIYAEALSSSQTNPVYDIIILTTTIVGYFLSGVTLIVNIAVSIIAGSATGIILFWRQSSFRKIINLTKNLIIKK